MTRPFWGLFYAQVIYSKVEEAGVGKAENEALLASARAYDWIAGVVGWVLLDLPNEAERMLDALADERAFVGVRHLVNVEPDPDWVVRSAVLDGLKVLAARGLTFDYVAILPRHLEHVAVLAQGIPDLRIVIDHLGKPANCRARIRALGLTAGGAPRACRMSSPKSRDSNAGQSDRWTADIAPYVYHALELFGPDRLMFGSDWPAAIPAGRLRQGVARDQSRALEGFHGTSESGFWAEPGVDFYRLRITDRP